MKHIKTYFITGIVAILPLFVTVFVLAKIFEWTNYIIRSLLPIAYIYGFILKFVDQDIIGVQKLVFSIIYLVSIIVIYILILVLGFLLVNVISKEKAKYFEGFFLKLPLVKNIYRTIKQISNLMFSKQSSSYKKVVLIEYPRKGLYSLAFLTKEENKYFENKINKELINVFMPTSPNPTSGMFLIVPKKDVTELDIKVEDAIKIIISGGAVMPDEIKKGEDI
ncbi:MAG: DUF502 domain-containing protein [Fusobacteriota bacterium]